MQIKKTNIAKDWNAQFNYCHAPNGRIWLCGRAISRCKSYRLEPNLFISVVNANT